ncbi:hypothetical protein ACIGKL_14975 [Pseudomonas sp. NPDC077186]|uniref:hypothetical protein n=1 Tax=Pseudomonas sp. NPDC077186 TaxID=3364421 RepID=UPI0037CC08F2
MSLHLDNQILERIYQHGTFGHSSAMRWSSTLMTFGLTFIGLFKLSGGQTLLMTLVASVFVGGLIYWLSGSKDPLRSGDPYTEFQRNALHLRMLCDNHPSGRKSCCASRLFQWHPNSKMAGCSAEIAAW